MFHFRILILYSLLSISFYNGWSADGTVNNGEITITTNKLDHLSLIRLNGKWRFGFDHGSGSTIKDFHFSSYEQVPASWTNYQSQGKQVPLHGTAYYHLTIRNPEKLSDLSLLVYGIQIDYKLWVNGEVMLTTKAWLPEKQASIMPERKRDLVMLPNDSIVDIVIKVQNNIHHRSGMTVVPLVGRSSELQRREDLRLYYEMVLVGCLLFMVIYHFVLYFQIKQASYILLGLLCLVVLLRSLIVFDGTLLLFKLFPAMTFEFSKKIEFFMVYSTLALYPLFFEHLFGILKYRKYSRIFSIASIALMTLVVVTPPYIFGRALNVYHILYLCSTLYTFYLIYISIRENKKGAKMVAIGVAISFVFILIEIIKNSELLDFYHGGPNLVNTGTVVFLFFQTVVISSIFANYKVETARKSIQLKDSELEKQTIESELKFRERELADYTISMIRKNRFLHEIEAIINGTGAKDDTQAGTILQNLRRSINSNRQSQNDWESFNKHFGNVHSDFFNKLKADYPGLSANDLRHCALIKMNLSIKEAADILGVDHKSIKTARYRMRKKMDLDESMKLKDVLANV